MMGHDGDPVDDTAFILYSPANCLSVDKLPTNSQTLIFRTPECFASQFANFLAFEGATHFLVPKPRRGVFSWAIPVPYSLRSVSV